MARSIHDLSPEEIGALSAAMQQLQSDADKLTKSQERLLASFGKLGKGAIGSLQDEVNLLKTYQELLEDRNSGQRDFNELLKLQNDIRHAEQRLGEHELRNQELQLLTEQDILKARQESYEIEEQALGDLILKRQKAAKDMRAELDSADKAVRKSARKKLTAIEEEVRKRQKTFDTSKKDVKFQEDALDNKKKELDLEDLRVKQGKKREKGLDSVEMGTKRLLKTTLGISDAWKDSFEGGLLIDFMLTGNLNASFAQIGATMAAMVNPLSLLIKLYFKVKQSTLEWMKETDQLAASFRKNTGIISKGLLGVEQQIVNVQRSLITQGVSTKEAFSAQNALNDSMAAFNFMGRKSQQRLLKITTLMGEFGVDAQTSARIMNGLNKGLGMNAAQLEKTSLELMSLSKNLKVPAKIISEDYAKAMPELMKYGTGMQEVFDGLAQQSKTTGLAMSELIGVAQQFDTFETAGESVGRLNAILGGPYLNAIQMLYSTEEERIEQLRDSIRLSGRQFSDLGRFEQQAIAAAAGIKDMQKANQLFNATDMEYDQHAMSMKEMQVRAAAAQGAWEKFKQAGTTFAIALIPLIDIMGALASALLFVLNPIGQIMKFFDVGDSDLIAGIGAATIVIYGLVLANKALGASWIVALGPILPFVAAFAIVVAALEAMTPGLRILIGLLVAVGAAFAIGAAVPSGMMSVAGFTAAAVEAPIMAGAAVAGLVGMASGLANYRRGKEKGEGEGVAFAGEEDSGSEWVQTADGGNYLVQNAVVDLGRNDTVFPGAQTAAMLAGGGGGGAEVAAMLDERLAALPDQLATAMVTNMPGPVGVGEGPVTVQLVAEGKSLGEVVLPEVTRSLQSDEQWGLSLTRGVV